MTSQQMPSLDDLEERHANHDGVVISLETMVPWDDGPGAESLGRELPSFPVDALGALGPWVSDLASSLQVDPGMVAMSALGAMSVAIGRGARVRITDSWWEPLSLYILVAAQPGELKTPTLSQVRGPLDDWIEIERAGRIEDHRRAMDFIEGLKSQLGGVKKALGTAAGAQDTDRVASLSAQLTQLSTEIAVAYAHLVPLPRYFIDDATPEALVSVMNAQLGAISVMASEGTLLENLLGRYNSSGGNYGAVLKAWDGKEAIIVDRANGTKTHIDNPYLTICLVVQPRLLEAIGGSADARGKGFTDRFLMWLPQSRIGYRSQDLPKVDGTVWRHALSWLRRLNPMDTTDPDPPVRVEMTLEAQVRFREMREDWERRRREGGDLFDLIEWSNKMSSQVARIAGILRLLEDGDPAIGVSHLERAGRIVEAVLGHVKAAGELMGTAETGKARKARKNAEKAWNRITELWVKKGRQLPFQVTRKEVFLQMRNRTDFTKTEDIDPVIDGLVRHGLLRLVDEDPRTRSFTYEVSHADLKNIAV